MTKLTRKEHTVRYTSVPDITTQQLGGLLCGHSVTFLSTSPKSPVKPFVSDGYNWVTMEEIDAFRAKMKGWGPVTVADMNAAVEKYKAFMAEKLISDANNRRQKDLVWRAQRAHETLEQNTKPLAASAVVEKMHVAAKISPVRTADHIVAVRKDGGPTMQARVTEDIAAKIVSLILS